jgi:flavorubredoxin
MAREIAPDIYWIQENGPDRSNFVNNGEESPSWYQESDSLHIAQNTYLIDGEQSLLFDTLSPASAGRILTELDELLDDGLDYLVISHPDVPHAGNAVRILEAHPETELIAPKYGNAHELYHLNDARKVGTNDSLDLGQYTVQFHEATFLDASLHMWMTEQTTNTLFPVDWLGYPHQGTEELLFADEFDSELTPGRFQVFHGRVMFWYQYVDVPKTKREIDRLIKEYDPSMIAPAHGNVIREEAPKYMEMMKPVVEQISDEGRTGTLG